EKYGFTEDEEGNSLLGVAEIIIAKHRNGALDDVRLRFKQDFAKFVDLEDFDPLSLGAPAPASAAMTFSSRMNEEESKAAALPSDFPLGGSKGFDEPPF
ncbi:MAG TPA: DnaB-like helicase C-terminal domain-containing protein, partial [Bacteroidales bacterium]|nr:DnaB-like helicase C-terminal domain-containing protein [Bacteroidales bacterium]